MRIGMGKTREKKHNNIMAQIDYLLAVATVFIGLWTLISTFYCQGGGPLALSPGPLRGRNCLVQTICTCTNFSIKISAKIYIH